MPLPINVGTGTVTGNFSTDVPDLDLTTWQVKLEPSQRQFTDVTSTPPSIPFLKAAYEASLDVDGNLSMVVPATNDADLNPLDFTYKVTYSFPGLDLTPETFYIEVPEGGTVNLVGLNPVQQSNGALIVEGVPTGGTTGQLLAKASGTNYDTEWVDPGAGGGATTLDGLTDVSTAGATAGQVLEFNGTIWVPGVDGGSSAWDDITGKPATFAPTIGTTATTAKAGNYTPTKDDVGLGAADNTSDAAKPISEATQDALDLKVETSVPLARYVLVATGSEARPAGAFCIWYDQRVDPATPPTNIGADDIWVTSGTTGGGSSDTTPPSIPTGLGSSSITSTSFTVSWTASTDDVGVTGYRVLIDGVSYATPSGLSQSVTGRTADTAYDVTVQARDAAGNWSDPSAILVVTTTSTPAETYSIFDTPPDTDIGGLSQEHNDGSSTQWVGDGFYRTGASLTVTGVRLWVPAASTIIAAETLVSFRVYTADWNGGSTLPTGAAVATATYSGPITAGTWVEADLNVPVTVAAVNAATSGNDVLWVVYQIGAGAPYVASIASGPSGSVGGPNSTYMAENSFPAHVLTTNGGSSFSSSSLWFGTDIKATV
jgi:hypothetical protein